MSQIIEQTARCMWLAQSKERRQLLSERRQIVSKEMRQETIIRERGDQVRTITDPWLWSLIHNHLSWTSAPTRYWWGVGRNLTCLYFEYYSILQIDDLIKTLQTKDQEMQKLQEEISALQRQQQALDARHCVQQQKLVDSTLASERAQELLKDRSSKYASFS